MDDIRKQALKRALVLLDAANTKYAVETEDGIVGVLKVEMPGSKTPKKAYRVIMRPLYEPQLISLEPGAIAKVRYPFQFMSEHDVKPARFRSSVYSYCYEKFGQGNYILGEFKGENGQVVGVEVLRVQ